MCVALFTACGAPATTATEEPSASVEATEEPSASVEATEEPSAAVEAEGTANDDFMSWTGTEWEAATAEQKYDAAEALLVEIGDVMLGGNFASILEEAKTNSEKEAELKEVIEKQLIPNLDQFFAATPTGNMQMFVDVMKKAVQLSAAL